MKSTFTQLKERIESTHKLVVLKKLLIKKHVRENIIETWFNHSSTSAIGYEFDFPHNY